MGLTAVVDLVLEQVGEHTHERLPHAFSYPFGISVEGPDTIEWPLLHWPDEFPEHVFTSTTLEMLETEIATIASQVGRGQ